MSKLFCKSVFLTPAILGATLLVSSHASAAPKLNIQNSNSGVAVAQATQTEDSILNQLDQYSKEGRSNSNSVGQVTSVNQLQDVSPTDWAYEALRSLVERYGCIAGYPNSTYRGNRAMTRYEFAAGLNACLNQIERLIASSESVLREDIDKLQRLTQEFQAELAALGTRVDNLEGRVAFLEDHQFSTTTKLNGEVIFALTDSFGDNDGSQTVFGDRFRLAFNTSFTGEDNLVTRIAGGNLGTIDDTAESTQTFNLGNNGNDAVVDWAAYYFPIKFGDNELQTYVAATGGIHSDYTPTINPYFEDYDGGNGALSTFASESPIYRLGGGAGAGVSYQFGLLDSILGPSTVTLGYLAGSDAASPTQGNGLFDGSYAALGQVNFAFNDKVNLGLTYVNAYFNEGSATFGAGGGTGVVGTNAANGLGTRRQTNTYGAEVAWKVSDKISLSGYFAYQDVEFKSLGGVDDEVWSYGAGVSFPDLGKEGNLLGIFGGVQPYLGENFGGSNSVPIHVEAFYKYKLNDNISVTPGVIWLSNPEQNENNDDRFIGTVRTTFTF